MKKSKKILLCLAQFAIIALFIVLAAGSAGEKEIVSTARGFNQGNYCISEGYTFIGYYNNSDCSKACSDKGYKYYCTGENTVWCGCK